MTVPMDGPSQVRLLSLADLAEGQSYRREFEMSPVAVEQFIRLSGDYAPVHLDASHAARLGFNAPVVHGLLAAVPYSQLLGMFLPGGNSVIQRLQLDMVAPVCVGDRLTYEVRVVKLVPAVQAVQLTLSAVNRNGAVVSRGSATCVMRA